MKGLLIILTILATSGLFLAALLCLLITTYSDKTERPDYTPTKEEWKNR